MMGDKGKFLLGIWMHTDPVISSCGLICLHIQRHDLLMLVYVLIFCQVRMSVYMVVVIIRIHMKEQDWLYSIVGGLG